MEDLDYAKMIEIPVSSCDVVYKKPKKFRLKKPDAVKQELIEAVNEEEQENFDEQVEEEEPVCEFADTVQITNVSEKQPKKKRAVKFDLITAQVGVVIVLALTIMFTNIFWQDSGLNVLLRSVFAVEDTQELSDANYSEFDLRTPSSSYPVTLEEGVMTFSGEGSVYSVCDGIITKVAQNAGKYDISIQYSSSFSAVISGADYAYYGMGDSVYKSVPVCYSTGGDVKVYLYNDGKLLTNYILDNGKIVWQS